mgnify:CR=1 FL=1
MATNKVYRVATMTAPCQAAHDTLLILSPPVRLIIWLDRIFEAKRAKGEEVPEAFDKWLQRWIRIRCEPG